MNKKYKVRLTSAEQGQLEEIVRKGKALAYKIRHANLLLGLDVDGLHWTDEQAAEAFHCSVNTVANIRQRFVEEGLESALHRKKQEIPSRKPILDGVGEAKLIALSCSQPPEGYGRWTLNLLADKLVKLEVVDSISRQTVHRILKKTNLSPTCESAGVFHRSKMRIS